MHPVTGLYRWWVFRQRLVEEIERAGRYKHKLSIILLEPANLLPEPPAPPVYGRAAKALLQALRVCDFAAQFDEERFVVLLPETDKRGAKAAGRRLLSALRSSSKPPVHWRGAIVNFPENGTDAMELLDQALATLYQGRLDAAGKPAAHTPDGSPRSTAA